MFKEKKRRMRVIACALVMSMVVAFSYGINIHEVRADENYLQTIVSNVFRSYIVTENGDLYIFVSTPIDKNRLNPPELFKIMSNVAQVFTGSFFDMAITKNGDLYVWNDNSFMKPSKYLSDVKKVISLGMHGLAIDNFGDLYAWGNNECGQLGDGTTVKKERPVKIMSGVEEISISLDASYAVLKNGDLYAWGNNEYRQLGDGSVENWIRPVKIMSGVKTGVGYLMIMKNGDLYARGADFQLNKIISDVSRLVGGGRHQLVVSKNGDLYAINNGRFVYDYSEIHEIPFMIISGVEQVAASYYIGSAVMKNGDLYTWGSNDFNMLSETDFDDYYRPTKVMSEVSQVKAGRYHNLALTRNGELFAWGNNDYGQIGDGTTESRLLPVKIMSGIVDVNAGYDHSLAVTNTGDLYVWGGYTSPAINHNRILNPTKILSGVAIGNAMPLIEEKEDYLYDQNEAEITLPTEKIEQVTDTASAKNTIKETASTLNVEQKQSANAIDQMTLFAEAAAAQAVTADVDSNDIVIDENSIRENESLASQAAKGAEEALVSSGITPQRELNSAIKYRTSSSNDVKITIDPSAVNTTADSIRVETPDYAVSLSKEALRENVGDSPLVITISEDENTISYLPKYNYSSDRLNSFLNSQSDSNLSPISAVLAALNVNKVKVGFNKPVNQNIKVSLPPASGDKNYQAVIKSDGTPVGGKYNPATDSIDVKIKESGTYEVRENQKNFSDIQNKAQEMQRAIKVLASKGIINGTTATEFSPDKHISRAEIAALIVRTLSKLDLNADGGFSDVSKSDWFCAAAGSAKNNGIMNGTSATIFEPRSSIKKDQIVAVAARTLRSEMRYKNPSDIESYLGTYKDRAAIPAWGSTDIAMATRENLVMQRSDSKFGPNSTMTRGDAAIVLYRMFMRIW